MDDDATGPELTLAEKLAMLDGDTPFWEGLAAFRSEGYNRRPLPAGVVERLGIGGIRFADGPRGVVLGNSTCFPVSMARGATWDPALEERVGEVMGAEVAAQGGNLFAGVCVNLLRHPAWGRAQETYGEDPHHVGVMGEALTRGVQRHVMACVKHFAANSIENARFQVDVRIDDATLHDVYLAHFERIVRSGVASVMTAYNALNGEWCGQNPELLGILRSWGFEGFVISDFVYGLRDPVRAVQAGLDIEMPFEQQFAAVLPQAVADGRLDPALVDRAVARILTTQRRFEPVVAAAAARPVDVAGPAHRALAREVAARSMVLLRNEAVPALTGTGAPGPATPVLPLPAGARVAVVGRLAGVANLGDRGSSAVRPPEVVTPQQGLAARFALVEDPAAADAAIVVVGFTHREEGEYIGASTPADLLALLPPAPERPERPEPAAAPAVEEALALGIGGDRERLTLSDDDEALILATVAANPRTVVVLEGGSAVLCERWRQRVPAIVMAWYPGMEGGHALADVLTGDINPGAKLPFAVPTEEAHLPPFDRNAMTIEYGPLHGYRLLHAEGHEAAFPFGFGLSYTRFVLGPSTLVEDAEGVTVTTTVTNVGPCDGEEVVQVYATAEGWPAPRLVGFRRAAIPTGAALDVSVRVAATEFATWDPALGLRTVTGPYRLAAGNHAGALEVVGEAWAGRPEICIGRLQTEVGHP